MRTVALYLATASLVGMIQPSFAQQECFSQADHVDALEKQARPHRVRLDRLAQQTKSGVKPVQAKAICRELVQLDNIHGQMKQIVNTSHCYKYDHLKPYVTSFERNMIHADLKSSILNRDAKCGLPLQEPEVLAPKYDG